MDRYLQIAREVLRSSRQPLSAREILRIAHQLQLVPRELYGRTQQKTMQARLASEILRNRSKSEFYRTGPGRFFLRALQSDRATPLRYRREYQAPLRAAQLGRFEVVAFPRAAIAELSSRIESPFPVALLAALPLPFMPLWILRRHPDYVPFRFHVLLFSEGGVFVDDHGSADNEMSRCTVIGLPGIVKRNDRSLFSSDDFGLVEAASRTLLERFDLPGHVLPELDDPTRWSEAKALVNGAAVGTGEVEMMVFIGFQCAGLTEIADAIRASSTSYWLPLDARPNDLDRFDRWSSRLLDDPRLRAELGG